jgi:hypothetical protein
MVSSRPFSYGKERDLELAWFASISKRLTKMSTLYKTHCRSHRIGSPRTGRFGSRLLGSGSVSCRSSATASLATARGRSFSKQHVERLVLAVEVGKARTEVLLPRGLIRKRRGAI